jgi:hypothetical protein
LREALSMKKKLMIFISLSLFLTLLVQPVSAATKTLKISVTFVSAELVENNHVGYDWYTTAYVNGKQINEGSTVTLNLKSSESVKLKAYAEEQDKIPDIGTTNSTIKVSSITKTKNKSLNVTVVENRGRYSGNSA